VKDGKDTNMEKDRDNMAKGEANTKKLKFMIII